MTNKISTKAACKECGNKCGSRHKVTCGLNNQHALKTYEDACYDIVKLFIETYFCDDKIKISEVDYYHIGGEVDGCVQVNDHFFSISDMYKALKLGATRDQLFTHYDEDLANAHLGSEAKPRVDLKNFIALTKETKL